MTKVLFVMIDGLGDVPGYTTTGIKALTPLQAAKTPNLDFLAQNGLVGLMDPFEAGIACGSDTAHLSIFGYNPKKWYRGRGAFETIGAGLPMSPGDIAFKCNFATLNPETGVVISRRADRYFESEGPVLCDYLNGTEVIVDGKLYTVAVKYATEHRCGVRIRGEGLVETVSGTDPLRDNLPLISCQPTSQDDLRRSLHTCRVVEAVDQKFRQLLQSHLINRERERDGRQPANVVLLRGCGGLPSFPSFKQQHGLEAFMIAPCCIIAGIGQSLGMDLIKVPGATGRADSNFQAKFMKAHSLLQSQRYDFGFVHIKAADEASHNGEPEEKALIIERVDEALGKFLQVPLQEDVVAVVTGDHTTPSAFYNDHTHHPVPFVLFSSKLKFEGPKSFDEYSAASGQLGRFLGESVMPLIKRFL